MKLSRRSINATTYADEELIVLKHVKELNDTYNKSNPELYEGYGNLLFAEGITIGFNQDDAPRGTPTFYLKYDNGVYVDPQDREWTYEQLKEMASHRSLTQDDYDLMLAQEDADWDEVYEHNRELDANKGFSPLFASITDYDWNYEDIPEDISRITDPDGYIDSIGASDEVEDDEYNPDTAEDYYDDAVNDWAADEYAAIQSSEGPITWDSRDMNYTDIPEDVSHLTDPDGYLDEISASWRGSSKQQDFIDIANTIENHGDGATLNDLNRLVDKLIYKGFPASVKQFAQTEYEQSGPEEAVFSVEGYLWNVINNGMNFEDNNPYDEDGNYIEDDEFSDDYEEDVYSSVSAVEGYESLEEYKADNHYGLDTNDGWAPNDYEVEDEYNPAIQRPKRFRKYEAFVKELKYLAEETILDDVDFRHTAIDMISSELMNYNLAVKYVDKFIRENEIDGVTIASSQEIVTWNDSDLNYTDIPEDISHLVDPDGYLDEISASVISKAAELGYSLKELTKMYTEETGEDPIGDVDGVNESARKRFRKWCANLVGEPVYSSFMLKAPKSSTRKGYQYDMYIDNQGMLTSRKDNIKLFQDEDLAKDYLRNMPLTLADDNFNRALFQVIEASETIISATNTSNVFVKPEPMILKEGEEDEVICL